MIEEILEYNKEFVKEKKYEEFCTDKYPNKKVAVLSCMDTRLTHLLPAALGLKNGDAKVIKNAGAQINNDYGSIVKSLLVAIYELGVKEILVIGHDDCGIQELDAKKMIDKMIARGIDPKEIERIDKEECALEPYLSGFRDINHSVCSTVRHLLKHPLMPKDITVVGLIMDPHTGEIRLAKE